MSRQTVAVLGGYGVFGGRIARSLARHGELDVIVAGRNPAGALRFAAQLAAAGARATLRAMTIDIADTAQWAALFGAHPDVVVDAVGPFQVRDYELARRCVETGVHYIDIADGRRYVAGMAA